MSRCARAEPACWGTGVNRHQDDEDRLQPAAKASTPGARHCADPGAPRLFLGCDTCPGFKSWPMAEVGSQEPGREKLQGRMEGRSRIPGALPFSKVNCQSVE